MQVRPDRPPDAHTFVSRRPVVAVARHDPAERRRALVEQRPTRVVLEARDRRADRLGERALEQNVADHPPLPSDRLVREERRPGHPGAVAAPVAPSEELVATADRQQRGTAVDGCADRLSALGEVRRDHRLLAILAAADVEEVVRPVERRRAERDRCDDELMAPRGGATLEHGDVPPVGVDVQVCGIEVGDADLHQLSQYGRVRPRCVAIARSRSIAV